MQKAVRALVFGILVAVALITTKWLTGVWFPPPELDVIWLYSGLLALLFSLFWVEPYYAAPTNVVVAALSSTLVLLSTRQRVVADGMSELLWTAMFSYCFVLLIMSLLAIVLKSESRPASSVSNRLSDLFKGISVTFGSGQVIYSILFVVFLLVYHRVSQPEVLVLLIIWAGIVLVRPQRLVPTVRSSLGHKPTEIGEIIGVQSRRIFLAKLYSNRPASASVHNFDPVRFRYSMRDDAVVYQGIVFDRYLLNQEKWVRILRLSETKEQFASLRDNVVNKVDEVNDGSIQETLDRLVGIVIENSDIGLVRFEYSSPSASIEEGDLVEISIASTPIYYQVINGITVKELLEAKNESGSIRVHCRQLGRWIQSELRFERHGWVPEINTVVLRSLASERQKPQLKKDDYLLGTIPGANLPCVMSMSDAIDYHLAILGVTGSGKSFIARQIIAELVSYRKVICVDFTGEWMKELSAIGAKSIIPRQDTLDELEEKIAQKTDAASGRSPNKQAILKFRRDIESRLQEIAGEFLDDPDRALGVFELPDMSNTSFILEFTQMFLDAVFKQAKEREETRVCLVIEEAHTVVPETNSLGDLGDYGSNKALVNKIGQIALQGRKYGVGFLVIAQRSANVSKTVLTQCNSIIAFQAFDKTSFDFLSNYIGPEYVHALPNLKQYNAVVVGKAFRSTVPLIVDLTRPTAVHE